MLLGLASCEKPGPGGFVPGDDVLEGEKTPLTLSVGLGEADASTKAGGSAFGGASTKAITVKPDDDNRLGELPEGTALYMVMVSSKKDTSPEQVKYAVTKGVTGAPNENKVSPISFAETGCTRYWDDTFARDAQIAVYAACSPGRTDVIQIGDATRYPYTDAGGNPIFPTSGAWSETEKGLTIAGWSVSSDQTAETLKNEDLCYSNNISVHPNKTATGTDDERLKFRSDLEQSDPNYRKFDKGHLCFYHALSKITFNIIQGDGFTDEEFKFNEGTNIKLTGFNTINTEFDIKTGEFTGTYASETINTIAQREAAASGCKFTLDALVMPGTDMSNEVKGNISLIIAHNQYDISRKDLLDRINGEDKTNHLTDGTKLKPGVHYIFTFRIGKTKVDKIDAAVVDWESVSAEEMSPSNARIKLSLEERGDAVSALESVGIYRAEDNPSEISDTHENYHWTAGYVGNGNTLSYNNGSWGLENKWYWPDNKTFYHFRAVMPYTEVVAQSGADDPVSPGCDYVALSSAAKDGEYVDVRWGAPFRDVADNEVSDSFKFKYGLDKGFDQTLESTDKNQLYQAIGPTEDRIKLTLFHMMSDVTFVIKSTVSDDEVILNNGTDSKVELLNYHQNVRVLMGTGKVETTGDAAAQTPMTFVEHNAKNGSTPAQSKYHYYPVPQSLAGVKLRITTPDKNQYIVDMANVNKTSYSNRNFADPYTGGKVDKWYPGFRYTYTFTLRKTGVESLQATIVGWEDVSAGDDNVQIE
ncbi:MAG: fimbrillin family protein [Candidatus Cryptobacteroides sp.]